MPDKTTIIISELDRGSCLTLPKLVKSEIIQNFGKESIQHWSELLGLGRLVMILSSEYIASKAFSLLRANHPEVKIQVSESILPRHRSFDGAFNAPLSLELQSLYSESKEV
jgi:hypothetical protein